MNNKNQKNIQNIISIRKIYMALVSLIILIWAFFKNKFMIKLFILPFIVCSIAVILENIFLILNKLKLFKIFRNIFYISFFTYVFTFLAYMTYYSIVNKSYSFLILVFIFLFFIINLIKNRFFKKK